MRKSIITSLKTLFAAARAPLYTRPRAVAKANLTPDPLDTKPIRTQGLDGWMFDKDISIDQSSSAASVEMNRLSHSLDKLGHTLTAIANTCPPAQASVLAQPCEILPHDSDLFDGEAMPRPPAQDTTIGGENVFLFGDAPAYQSAPAQHAA